MQNSEPHDSSSLQAILYIDRVAAAKEQSRQPSRLPNAAAMGICVLAAACAVGAVTYKFKQAPSVAVASNSNVHVTHAAAAPHIIVEPQLRVHREKPAINQHAASVVIAHTARTTTHVQPSTPIHIQRTPQLVAVATPVAALPIEKKPVALPAAHPITPKLATVKATAVHKLALASIPAPLVHHATHPSVVHHHRVYRRFAALKGGETSAVHYAMLAQNTAPSVADPIITRFDAAPTSIPEGSGASLCVAARHATQLSISGVGEVNPLLIDCRHVSPAVTTTYTTWAVNKLGVTVSQNVTVTVTH